MQETIRVAATLRRRAARTRDARTTALPESAAPGGVPEVPSLSVRQRQILRCLVSGAHNKAIASQLGIGLVTVKMHVGRLFRKLGVTNRTEAAVRGLQLGARLYPEARRPAPGQACRVRDGARGAKADAGLVIGGGRRGGSTGPG